MTIPLVTRQINLVRSNSLLGVGAPFSGTGRITDFQLARPNYSNDQNSDAVKISLSGERGEASQAASLQASNAVGSGVLPGALQELGRISDRIGALSADLASENITADRKSALEAERTALGTQYQSIINSSTFQSAVALAKDVRDTLNSGVDPNALARSLNGSRALLGDSYLNVINGGYYSNLQTIGSSLDTLLIGDPLTSPEQASTLSSAAKGALAALSVNAPQQSAPATESVSSSLAVLVLPKLQELQFQSGGGVTVGLRGYSGADIITAAAAGLADGGAPQLILTMPKIESLEAESKRAAENTETVQSKFPNLSVDANKVDTTA